MNPAPDSDLEAYAAALSESLTGVVQDLHAIDPVDLVSFIRFGSFAALEDLLQAATELFFRDGTLRFGWTARTDIAWDEAPRVTLGMEFQNAAVWVFFDLSLSAFQHSVAVMGVQFDVPDLPLDERVRRFASALAGARLPSRIPFAPAPTPRG